MVWKTRKDGRHFQPQGKAGLSNSLLAKLKKDDEVRQPIRTMYSTYDKAVDKLYLHLDEKYSPKEREQIRQKAIALIKAEARKNPAKTEVNPDTLASRALLQAINSLNLDTEHGFKRIT